MFSIDISFHGYVDDTQLYIPFAPGLDKVTALDQAMHRSDQSMDITKLLEANRPVTLGQRLRSDKKKNVKIFSNFPLNAGNRAGRGSGQV